MKTATKIMGVPILAFLVMISSTILMSSQLNAQVSQQNMPKLMTYYSVQDYSDQIPALQSNISVDFKKVPRVEALFDIAAKAGLEIAFDSNKLDQRETVTFSDSRITVSEALQLALDGTGYEASITNRRQIILTEPVPMLQEILDVTLTGRVTDADTGEPLVGVTVYVEGTQTGTTTDPDGFYELDVADDATTLTFSYVGYMRQDISIGNQTTINVELQTDIARLDDLVVVGYGVQRRSEITGSVGIVPADELTPTSFNALQGLRGKVAGVNIFTNSGSPSGSNRVIIRGTGSINSSTDPLYIVDGVAMDGAGINFLNPNDIESIEVLKDASATAIYGARGANGVILVTTRRGGDSERVVVGYSSDLSVGHMLGRMDVMNAEEFMQVQRTALQNVPLFNSNVTTAPTLDTSLDPFLFDANGNPIYDTDWQDEATRTAFSQDHNLSIRGGTERSSIGAVLNYTNREGVLLNSYMNRASLKLVYDVTPKDWLTFGTNLTVAKIDENHVEEGGGGQEPRRTMIEMAPILPVIWPDGTPLAGQYSNQTHVNSMTLEGQSNPVHRLLEEDRLRDRTQLFGNTFMAIQITPNLEFRTQFGLNNRIREERRYRPSNMIAAGAPDGVANFDSRETNYWQSENFLTYQQDFARSRLTAMLGASWQEQTFTRFSQEARGFSDDFFKFNNFGAATDIRQPTSDNVSWSLNSYFNRVTYSIDDTYTFTFTSRFDGSSRFGANSKWGFFPSAGVSWQVSNEEFMQDVEFVDNFRLRSSYGVTGNTEIGEFQSLATIGSGTTLIGGQRQSQSFTTRLPNPDLEWEKTYQFNIGTDLDLFNQFLSLEMDYYYKLTTDLLLERPVPGTTGFTVIRDNVGSLSNRGVDVKVTTSNIRKRDLFWSTTLNFNYNKNRVESLGVGDEDIFPGPNWVSGSQTILRVGEPVGNFYGFERIGTWGTDEAAEAAAAGRIPGEAKRSEDRRIIGNGLPDFTGSFINEVNFRNFDFMLDLQFVLGSDIMQQFLHTAEDRQALTNGLATQLEDAWTESNQNTMIQRIRHQPISGQNTQADSHWIVDGSYVRGNLIQLGYNFDPSIMENLGLTQLRVAARVENAFVIHDPDFKGHDPEATSWGGNIHAQNIFFYQYPRPRTFSLGVSLQF